MTIIAISSAHDDAGPFISGPTNSRIVGTPTIYLARRIDGPDHNILGLVVGAIDLQYVNDFYRMHRIPAGETVTLLRRDGLVLARYPDPTDGVGNRMAAISPWHRLVSGGAGPIALPDFSAP